MDALVKTIRGIMSDNSLPKFTVLKLHINSGSGGQYGEVRIVANETLNVQAVGGFIGYNATMVTNETTEFDASTFNLFCSTNEFNVEIQNEYDIVKFLQYTSRCVINTEQLKYLYGLNEIALKASATGDIANLADLTEVTNLDLASSYVTGNIQDVSGLYKLTSFNIGYTGTRIKGSLEDFAIKQYISRGNQSGNITMNTVGNSVVTFNGTAANANSTLSWAVNSSDNTKLDVTYNGVTVTVPIS